MKAKPIVHLREIFWRPDILAQHQVQGVANVTKCALCLPSAEMTCDTREVTCEACRHNFIEGLITGTGERLTWDQYMAQKEAHTFPTLQQKAAASASQGGWSTGPVPPADGWTTKS